MPIHLIWGDDCSGRDRAIQDIINKLIDPDWISINLARLDGKESGEAAKALESSRTPPLARGDRVTILHNSPFCSTCSGELADQFEATLEIIPENSHLILVNSSKPDGRLRTTKALQKRIKKGLAHEQKHQLPAIWDESGQRELVETTAKSLGLSIDNDAINALVEAIGSNSSRLESEMRKISIRTTNISAKLVAEMVNGLATNALQVGESLLEGNQGKAINRWDALIDSGEPSLRIIATLTGQIRGWLWVSLLDQQGEKDVTVISKAAGISNPKRIYVMRKQLKGSKPQKFLSLLRKLLDMEAQLKRGVQPKEAFRDALIIETPSLDSQFP